MKKLLIVLALVAMTALLFCGCGNTSSEIPDNDDSTSVNEGVTVPTREEALMAMVDMYQKGEWAGQTTTNPNLPGHEYAIQNGILLEDGAELGIYPDIVIGDVSFKGGKFLGTAPSADGIIITDGNYYSIGRFYKGKLIDTGDILDEEIHHCDERAKFFVVDRFVVMQFGQHLRIWDYLNDWKVEGRDDVLDVVDDGNNIKISTLSHENYKLNYYDGTLTKTDQTSYAKFPTDVDLTMMGIPMDVQENLRPNGRVLYAGTGIDQLHYYMYSNGDGKTYTLVMRDDDEGEVEVIAKNVVDAETSIGICYYITTDGTVYRHTIRNGVEKVYTGTAYGLTPTWTEDDIVCIITTEKEATAQDTSNGWNYLTY